MAQKGTIIFTNTTAATAITITGEQSLPDNALLTSDGKVFMTSQNETFVVATA